MSAKELRRGEVLSRVKRGELKLIEADKFSQLDDGPEGRALDTPLQQTDVGAVESALQRQLLLRHLPFLADLAKGREMSQDQREKRRYEQLPDNQGKHVRHLLHQSLR